MKWNKRGILFVPDGRHPAMQSHAALPTTLGDRVYFASRDGEGRSHIWWVEHGSTPDEPVLSPGAIGCFDQHGVFPACLVEADDRVFLYYIGWTRGAEPPLFYASVGLAISDDGGATFERHSAAPIMARSAHDPCLVTSPCVRRERDLWRMWYVSGYRWVREGGALASVYHIKYAESDDGIEWRRDGRVAIELADGEKNVARPCVVRDGDLYRMWYCYNRGEGYRLGYAESRDGLGWTRRDEHVGIALSESGAWDDRAMAYPWVSRTGNGERVLFYNGNDFGREGFGWAVEDRA